MRILLLAKKPPFPPKDGEAIAILQMAKGLQAAGAEVSVLYMNTRKHHFDAHKIPKDLSDKIHFYDQRVNAGITLVGAVKNLFQNYPYHVERFGNVDFESKLIRLLKENEYDIVQAEGLYLVQYFNTVRQYSKAKCIYRSHNVEADIWEHLAVHAGNIPKKIYLRLQSKKLRSYENKMIITADSIVPISIKDAREYEAIVGRQKIKYVPAGIDVQKRESVVPENLHDIYFIGGLDWLPNLEGLSWFTEDIFPEVREEFPKLTFHIAGRNAPASFKKKLGDGIIFYGEVDNAEAFAADKLILVVPLLSGGGMKLKIPEAMAAGKYVITTTTGAEGMPPGMDDFFTTAHDEHDFIFKLTFLLKYEKATRENALHGQDFVFNNLDNHKLCAGLLRFYESL